MGTADQFYDCRSLLGVGKHHVHGLIFVQSQPICRPVPLSLGSPFSASHWFKSEYNQLHLLHFTYIGYRLLCWVDRLDEPRSNLVVLLIFSISFLKNLYKSIPRRKASLISSGGPQTRLIIIQLRKSYYFGNRYDIHVGCVAFDDELAYGNRRVSSLAHFTLLSTWDQSCCGNVLGEIWNGKWSQSMDCSVHTSCVTHHGMAQRGFAGHVA